jgi:uncharacterized membrane protein YbhN (UPF0104 family)
LNQGFLRVAQPQTPVALAPPPASRRSIWLKWLAGLAVGAAFTWWSSRSWPLDKLFGGTLALVNGHHATQSTWAERLSLHHGLAVALQRPGTDGSLTVTWSLDLTALVLYFVILTAIHWLRVLRWRPLLEPHASVPLAVLNRAGAVGFMAVFLLPLRLGEFARPLMLARTHAGHTPVRFGAGLGVIALERVLDGLMVTGLLFAVLIQVPADVLARSPQVQLGGLAALAVFGSALGGLTATLVAREWTLRLTRSVLGAVSPALADKVIGLVTAFVDGLAMLKSPWHVAQFFLLTAVYWAINGAGLWVMAQGFGLDVPLAAGYAMMSCIVVGMMIPNSPGNVGSFWYFLLLPAGLWGVDQAAAPAVAFGLAVWLAQTVQTTAFGLLGSWADARALAQIAQSDVESPG